MEDSATILLVDDTESNVLLVQRVIQDVPGWNVVTALTAEEAMLLAVELRPDIILLDVNLPNVEGTTLLKHFRSDPATAGTPVVMVSADVRQAVIEEFLAAGAQQHITKPIDIGKLIDVVRAILKDLPR
ncbi:MAG: response regulator [Armatimonadetes bacterium]|nr:response regulator [Armatimonadota bacterium]